MRQPGGNVTGFSLLEFSLGSKWLDLLKGIAPSLARISIMFSPDTAPFSKFFMPVIEAAAALLDGGQSLRRCGLPPRLKRRWENLRGSQMEG